MVGTAAFGQRPTPPDVDRRGGASSIASTRWNQSFPFQLIVVEKTGVKIGSKLKVSVATDAAQSPEKLISAEVTSLEVEVDTTGSFTVIRGYVPAHRLFRGRHSVSYTQATASDAATQVARRAGLGTGDITSSKTVYDHLGQCGQTDWNSSRSRQTSATRSPSATTN
jgi:hypothetical protein